MIEPLLVSTDNAVVEETTEISPALANGGSSQDSATTNIGGMNGSLE